MSKRQRARSSNSGLIGLIQQDQFGSLWLSLLVFAVFFVKWFFISPVEIEGDPCVLCVVLLLWLMCTLVSLLISGLWWAWGSTSEKGITMMFVLAGYILGCVLLADYVVQRVMNKLYTSGMLSWPEAGVSFLLDDMVRHAMGLFLATAVIYSMLRLILCHDLADKKIVITVSLCILLGTSGLMFIGVKLY